MKLVRTILLSLAFTLPVSWSVAHAGDEAPAGDKTETKTTKKTKKSKKGDGSEETKSETKTEKTEKKAE